jgi:peroxiredoxin Q/BCP
MSQKTREKSPRPSPGAKARPVSIKAPAGKLVEGARAPSFSVPIAGGGTVSPADFAGRKLVIFFYPRTGTEGCTRETLDFSRLASSFAAEGADLLGVSADSLKTQESFHRKNLLKIPLASDEEHRMLSAYDVWQEKSMYGKTFMGIVRTTVLIDAHGKIERVWLKVKVDGHAEEVLSHLRKR